MAGASAITIEAVISAGGGLSKPSTGCTGWHAAVSAKNAVANTINANTLDRLFCDEFIICAVPILPLRSKMRHYTQ
jgi:hypothetical protein